MLPAYFHFSCSSISGMQASTNSSKCAITLRACPFENFTSPMLPLKFIGNFQLDAHPGCPPYLSFTNASIALMKFSDASVSPPSILSAKCSITVKIKPVIWFSKWSRQGRAFSYLIVAFSIEAFSSTVVLFLTVGNYMLLQHHKVEALLLTGF